MLQSGLSAPGRLSAYRSGRCCEPRGSFVRRGNGDHRHGADRQRQGLWSAGRRIPDLRAGSSADYRAEASNAGSKRRSEEHTSELQSLMRISYAVFCLKKKNKKITKTTKSR